MVCFKSRYLSKRAVNITGRVPFESEIEKARKVFPTYFKNMSLQVLEDIIEVGLKFNDEAVSYGVGNVSDFIENQKRE